MGYMKNFWIYWKEQIRILKIKKYMMKYRLINKWHLAGFNNYNLWIKNRMDFTIYTNTSWIKNLASTNK